MKIDIIQSGGFANKRTLHKVDTAKLQPAEANEVEKLVRDADFFNQPYTIGQNLGCDMLEYDIQVEDNAGQTKAVHVNGVGVPNQLMPFMDWCKKIVNSTPGEDAPPAIPFLPPFPNALTDVLSDVLKWFGGK